MTVSRVVKVFDETMHSASSTLRSRVASAKSVPSMLETKRKVRSRWLHVRIMIHEVMPQAVVARGEMAFRDGHADAIGKSLAERTGGGFHDGGHAALGMTGREAAPLAKPFDLFERQMIARKIQHTVQQHRPVTGRQDESVSIEPVRIGQVMLEKSCPQDIGHRGRPQRQAWMALSAFCTASTDRKRIVSMDNCMKSSGLRLVAPAVFIVRFPGRLPVAAPPLRNGVGPDRR